MSAAVSKSKGLLFSESPEKAARALIKSKLRNYLSKEAQADFYQAFLCAEQYHRGQTRHSGEAYIHHPIAVAGALAELQMDVRTLMAAVLHDVVEDTGARLEDIRELFGDDVALLVDGVSKIGQIKFRSREHAEAENLRKMIMAMSKDVRVMIVKLADRLHNMRTLEILRPAKQKRISKQTLEVYAPIAERLGLYHWARELQDLCFKYLYPTRHLVISKALKARQGNRKSVVEKLRKSIDDTLGGAGLSDYEVKGGCLALFTILINRSLADSRIMSPYRKLMAIKACIPWFSGP